MNESEGAATKLKKRQCSNLNLNPNLPLPPPPFKSHVLNFFFHSFNQVIEATNAKAKIKIEKSDS